MANIKLHSDSTNTVTSVSNIFIDEYMSDANGEFVKIYLYLLRLMNAPETEFSISSIADKFEHTEKDVKRALSYWERMHLLHLEYDEQQNLTGICMTDSFEKKQDSVPSSQKAASEEETAAPTAPAHIEYSADDIKRFRQEDAVAELFFITERYLGRTLNATDTNTILYLYDGLHFSTELIEYLVEYCVTKGHTSIRYIEKTALGWAKQQIHTVEEAKQSAGLHNQTYFTVIKALGISGRNLVPLEIGYIEKWKNEYAFTNELIQEACQRTIAATHQPSFEYTDSILTNWHKNQVRNMADVSKLDAAHLNRKKMNASAAAGNTANAPKNRFNNFKQRSYDYDQLEKMLLTTDTHS